MSEVTNEKPIGAPGPGARKPKGRPIEMRTVHRVLSLIAFLFMLYVGVTGTWIQAIDLKTILSGAPESDPVMQSINEGKFGNGYYSVVTRADWRAAALPKDLDIGKAFGATLAAFHEAEPGRLPAFVDLRVVKGRVIGQVAYPEDTGPPVPGRRGPAPMETSAFDVATGTPVDSVDINAAKPVKSLRQTLKQWHRFWGPDFFSKRDKPGVYIEFIVGIVMWVLIVTGLVMYFRLLKQRRKMGRPQLFWVNGEIWRSLHRVVSVASAILLILVAASGTWLGFESSYSTFAKRNPPPKVAAMTDAQILRVADGTMKAFRADEPDTPIRVIRARVTGGKEEGAVVTADGFTRQRVFAVPSGRELKLTEPHYRYVGFPFGLDVHEWVKHFHSGYLFGLPARFLDLLAGLALVFLAGSGIWMYIEMYRKRALAGRKGWFWK